MLSTSPLPLRPYQKEALAAIYEADKEGTLRQLVALPTGTGKTVIFSYLIALREGRALVLVHRDELIRQTLDKLLTVCPSCPVGVVKAEQNDVGALVVVASVQTLSRPNRLQQLAANFNTVVIDEAHHAPAATYQRVMEHLGCFEPGGPLTVGFTATPERADKVGLGTAWEKIVFQKPLLDMILEGYLADLRAVRISVQADLDQVRTRGGDFVESDLDRAMMAADAPEHIVAAYQEHGPERKALVFTPSVRMAYAVAEAFQDAGIAAEAFDGSTPTDERRALLARLHSGETPVVCNCLVLTEGFDEPSVDCIIIARPTKSKPLYIQMVGRGTRTYPGKLDCLILDVVGVTQRRDIMTATELFDLDMRTLSVKEAVEEREQREREAQEQKAAVGQRVAQEVNLFGSRRMHWVQTRDGAWVLSLGEGGYIRLQPAQKGEGLWSIYCREPSGEVRLLQSGLPLEYAQGRAEDHARNWGSPWLLDPQARWRTEPASLKQLNWMRWKGIPITPGLTKGQASDIRQAYEGGRR